MACPTVPSWIQPCDFTNYLVNNLPVFDKEIIADIRPTDGWTLNVKTGTWPSFSHTVHRLNRFTHVWPNTTHQWTQVPTDPNCTGNPCDKTEHCIGWGNEYINYYLEEQSWATPLFCYDQLMHITEAKEHLRQIIGQILRPATITITSNFFRKRAVTLPQQNKWVADANMTGVAAIGTVTFTFTADANGDEIWMDTNAIPTSKLTPQMLQRRVMPLLRLGYAGRDPFKGDGPPLMELVTDMDTCWDLDKQSCQASGGSHPNMSGNWRFTEFSAANKYWRYGFSGQIGNFGVRVDPFQLRFFYAGETEGGLHRFRVVQPYVNNAAGNVGLQSWDNTDYQLAPYCFSHIWHKMAMEVLVADAAPVNPEMPFSSRNLAGKWQFVMDNLGAGLDSDSNPVIIENKRRNKGQFIADFKMGVRPLYPELSDTIFHLREPSCIVTCTPCAQFDYPAQDYNSCNDSCS